jgi:Zn-finger nucleic acid-binding protein
MKCPVCEDQPLAISSRDGVEIDYCQQCRGVWLDRGELDKIIDRAAVTSPAPAALEPSRSRDDGHRDDRYRDDDRRYDDRRPDKRKKRRSFLEDIFDFD